MKSYVFKDIVIIFCPRTNNCNFFCPAFKKYDKLGYDIMCPNPSFYKEEDIGKVLGEELKKRSESEK